MGELEVSEVSRVSPEMEEGDFRALVEDIRKNGQLVPIWVMDGQVIDGRKRLAACRELGIQPKVVDAGGDPAPIAYSLNVLRTHYTHSQRAIFAARIGRDRTQARNQRTRTSLPAEQPTQQRLARDANVGKTTIISARRVLKRGSPELIAAVESGRLALNAAETVIREVPQPEQAEAVRVLIAGTSGSRTPAAKILGTWDGKRRAPQKPLAYRVERAVSSLETATAVVGTLFTDEAKPTEEHVVRLRKCRTQISRIIHGNGGSR